MSELFCFTAGKTHHSISFDFDSEYNTGNLLKGDKIDYFYNSMDVELRTPKTWLEITLYRFVYDMDYLVYGFDNRIPFKYGSAAAMFKFTLPSDIGLGLGIKYKALVAFENLNSEVAGHAELTKKYSVKAGEIEGRAYLEQDLTDGNFYSTEYLATHFFDAGKELGLVKRLMAVELKYLSNKQNYPETVPPNYPLAFSPANTMNLGAACYYNDNVKDSQNSYMDSVIQTRLAVNYKPTRWLEMSLNNLNTNVISSSTYNEYRSISRSIEAGFTSTIVQSGGLNLSLKSAFLYNDDEFTSSTIFDNKDEDYINVQRYLVPSLILIYGFRDYLTLDAMLSRKYYTGEPNGFNDYLFQRNWDGTLALSASF